MLPSTLSALIASQVVEEGGDEVYTDLLYSEGEDIYGTGATTPDEKRNCVVSHLTLLSSV